MYYVFAVKVLIVQTRNSKFDNYEIILPDSLYSSDTIVSK